MYQKSNHMQSVCHLFLLKKNVLIAEIESGNILKNVVGNNSRCKIVSQDIKNLK